MAHLHRRTSPRFLQSAPYPHYQLPSYPASWPAYPSSEPCYPQPISSPSLQFSSLESRPYKNDLPRSPSLTPDFIPKNTPDDLCTLTDQPESPCTTSSPPCSVKVEPDDPDGCFIMELSSSQSQSSILSQKYAPPTEVPLRATQASSDMRKMMGVFRLNPFAMHSGEGRGVVSPTWYGGEARPLDEEPVILEFQIELDDLEVITAPSLSNTKEQLRSFSPEFQLHRDELKNQDRTDWDEHHSEDTTTPSGDWDEPELPAEDYLPPAKPINNYLRPHTRLHNSISHPYLRKSQTHHQHQIPHDLYTGFTVSAPNLSLDLHRMPPAVLDDRTRSGVSFACFGGVERAEYAPRHNNIVYPSSSGSPVCEAVGLPSVLVQDHIHPSSIGVNVSRRWSLPENAAPPNGPFLM